ncbi:MAG TPA: imidazole glycerol phosphate synthase subunit HisH [Gammaproteobacteria bacterium]|nr:imidazole glycerol phosphate synthase subunit HisH [Gammaproteobacteria bacterium]
MKANAVIIPSCGSNLASLQFALERLGADVPLTEDPARIRAASHVILPGVGAAAPGMQRLAAAGLVELIPTLSQPVLGICLGMQLLFASSEEEQTRCLGVIDAEVRRFPARADLPVPQMGWNEIEPVGDSPLLAGVAQGTYAYFVHSYAAPPGPYTRAVTSYGVPFSAVIEQGNFYGTQFHPERSSRGGAQILDNFLKIGL